MTILYVLIALSLCAALGFLWAFLWAVRSGQYDDTHTPSMRVLFEDTSKTSQTSQTFHTPNKAAESKTRVSNHA
jgi:cbb3-type cytochrome oxidase maturation protein